MTSEQELMRRALEAENERLRGGSEQLHEWHDRCVVEKEEITKAYNNVREENERLVAITRVQNSIIVQLDRGRQVPKDLREALRALRGEGE